MYVGQVSRHDILLSANQLAKAISTSLKVHMVAPNYLLRFLTGSALFSITYKQEGFKHAACSDANWGNNPHNGKSTSSYIVMLANGSISFKVSLQSLTTQSTMEAEFVAAALTMKEGSNIMKESFENR